MSGKNLRLRLKAYCSERGDIDSFSLIDLDDGKEIENVIEVSINVNGKDHIPYINLKLFGFTEIDADGSYDAAELALMEQDVEINLHNIRELRKRAEENELQKIARIDLQNFEEEQSGLAR